MLSSLRLSAARRLLVIFLMALSTVVAVQRAQAVTNGVEHELAIEHSHPALELAAAEVHDDDGASRHHEDGDPSGDRSDGAPGPHHHHADGPQVATLSAPALAYLALTRSEAVFAHVAGGSPRSLVLGLERPPKSQGDTRA